MLRRERRLRKEEVGIPGLWLKFWVFLTFLFLDWLLFLVVLIPLVLGYDDDKIMGLAGCWMTGRAVSI